MYNICPKEKNIIITIEAAIPTLLFSLKINFPTNNKKVVKVIVNAKGISKSENFNSFIL